MHIQEALRKGNGAPPSTAANRWPSPGRPPSRRHPPLPTSTLPHSHQRHLPSRPSHTDHTLAAPHPRHSHPTSTTRPPTVLLPLCRRRRSAHGTRSVSRCTSSWVSLGHGSSRTSGDCSTSPPAPPSRSHRAHAPPTAPATSTTRAHRLHR